MNPSKHRKTRTRRGAASKSAQVVDALERSPNLGFVFSTCVITGGAFRQNNYSGFKKRTLPPGLAWPTFVKGFTAWADSSRFAPERLGLSLMPLCRLPSCRQRLRCNLRNPALTISPRRAACRSAKLHRRARLHSRDSLLTITCGQFSKFQRAVPPSLPTFHSRSAALNSLRSPSFTCLWPGI